uniref:Ig-like domain-containing protein n=1 Tax=Sus scrofa TaxID=9823 RepID=A0A8D0V385_PIG
PQGPWTEDASAETWDTESKELAEGEDLRKCLGEILGLQKEKGGLHSLQEIVSCEMGEDSHPRGVRRLYYDGELLLSCGLETHGCTVPQASAQTLALEMEKTCDMDELSRHYWAHVRGELCAKLQGYLKSWTSFTERTVPPAVTVTCSQALEGTDNLTCQAVSFSPQNISVAWYQDEKAVSPDTQQSGGVLPDGNGTYQTWVTLRVPQGEEQRFSCHVEHGGNHSVHAVPCAPHMQLMEVPRLGSNWSCSRWPTPQPQQRQIPSPLRGHTPKHMEVPRLGIESAKLPAYTTAMLDLSQVCDLPTAQGNTRSLTY